MKCISPGQVASLNHGSRLGRRLLVLAAAALVAATGWAQNSVFTLAGAVGNPGYTNATGTAAQFNFTSPSGVAVDGAGNAYIADALNNAIRKIDSAGVVTTFAGSATGVAGNTDATGTSALFRSPQGIAIDGAGNLFVADTGNHAIRMITPAGVVTTLAGNGNTGAVGLSGYTNATGTAARFNTPLGLFTDRTGVGNAALNVFVADTINHAIRKIVVATGVTTTLAGPTVAGTSGSANGTLANARFALPSAITGNTGGTLLYVADTNNHLIREINVGGDFVTTLAGSVGVSGYVENTGTAAQFNFPRGIAMAASGNILVGDTLNHVIRSVTPATSAGVTTLFAGTPNVSGSTNGLATSARFSFPTGVAADATSQYIVDTNNQIVRKISPATAPNITGQPASTVTVTAGNTANFSVTATGNPPVTFQWQRSTDSGATWNDLANGAITGGVVSGATTNALAISNVTSALNGNQFRVIVSNGIGSAATSNASALTVQQVPVITNANPNFTVGVNTAISATITASGSPTPTFNAPTGNFPSSWATFNTTTGVIAGSPPNATGSPFTFSVTATNSAGTSAPVAFTITVQTGPSILTPPSNQSVTAGQTAQFTVSASSSPAITGYQWQFSNNSGATWTDLSDGAFPGGGTISGATTIPLTIFGTTAAMNNYQFRVVVTNSVGSTTSIAALLTVTSAPQAPIFTSVASTTFVANQANSYPVAASGSPVPTYSISGGSLPAFAALNPTTGVLTGFPSTSDIAASPYFFTISASNSQGSAQQGFTLSVSSTPLAPAISTHPTNRAVGLNQITTFNVVATGSPTPSYQWQRFRSGDGNFISIPEGGSYSGTLTDTLTINGVTAEMNGDIYRVIVNNIHGTATSNSGQLTISIGTVFTTIAGQALLTGAVDGTGSGARFNAPNSIAVDTAGNAYVADAANHIIRKVTPAGVVTTIAGFPNLSGSLDGTGNAARFNTPSAIAVDSAGILYVADTGNHTIRTINSVGTVTTLAGTAQLPGTTDGIGANARFSFPSGIAVDSFGTIYVADTVNHAIRRITSGGIVTTFVPSTSGLSFPNGLAVDSSFNVYVADARNHVIRKVTSGGVMTTFAGLVGSSGATDGTATFARFNTPQGVAVDSSGTVYVADTVNHTLRRVSAAGDVTTLAGLAGQAGSTDGSGSTVRFNQPYGVAVDSAGNLWIADTFSHTLRRSGTLVAPQITTQPSSQFGAVGGSVTFSVAASGTPSPGFQWQRQAAGTFSFVNLTNDATYSGVNTANLTISGITAAMNGDQFQVVASNLTNPNAISSPVVLSLVTPPVITSAATATFTVGQAGSFTVTATASPVATFSAAGLPSWASINPSSGVISGTPPDTNGSPFSVVITANNGSGASTAVTQNFQLVVQPAQVPPSIASHPAAATVNVGDAPTFTVTATGSSTLTYQWLKDGAAINGATSSSYTVPSATVASAGVYSVRVSNPFGTVTSNIAGLVVLAPPVIATQPRTQTVLVGSAVTFTVGVSGPSPTYQWRKNGVNIPGATSAILTLFSVTAADAGNYDVVVENPYGGAFSSLAQLQVVTVATAPTFVAQPASRSVVAGANVLLSGAATGAPSPTFQWRKNGVAIPSAISPTLSLTNIQVADGGVYDLVVSNSSGTITSLQAVVRVFTRSYAGLYFGAFGGGLGNFALYIRNDNTGVFLGYLPGSTAPVMSLNVEVNDSGGFSFSQTAIAVVAPNAGEPPRAAALASVAVSGTISDTGVNGSIVGGANTSFSALRSPDNGSTAAYAGFYQAGSASNAATAYTIANAAGQAFVVVQSGTVSDGGSGGISSSGQVGIVTSRTTITESIQPTGAVTVTAVGAVNGNMSGANETVLASQRLANISSRARVTAGTGVAIAGFVISGTESKPVLIRAVGPSLTSFGVPGVLATPSLELYRGSTSIDRNTGVSTSINASAIAAAGVRAGAFALGTADSAILTTLTPGNYTAIVSGANNAQGVALVEVYDLSAPAAGQKLLNISTRATAGTGGDVLTAGVVVTGTVPKRVLIRAVGPGLAQLGLTGVLPNPTLTLINSGVTVAQNTGFGNSLDATAISTTGASVGAFPMVAGDSAMIVSLPPGNYTAQVTSATNATGVAIVEVYELP